MRDIPTSSGVEVTVSGRWLELDPSQFHFQLEAWTSTFLLIGVIISAAFYFQKVSGFVSRSRRGAHDSLVPSGSWGDPRLKSSGLQPPILKSLKSMPRHTFKAPETNRVKSVKSGRFS